MSVFSLIPPSPALLDARLTPTWRRERAIELSATDLRYLRLEDSLVREFCKYLRAKTRNARPNANAELSREFGPLFDADNLFDNPAHAVLRMGIEALVLGRATPEQIGEHMGLEPVVVQLYEALHYDVRSRLHRKGYVQTQLLGATQAYMDRTDIERQWKTLAYYCGADRLIQFWEIGPGSEELNNFYKAMARTGSAKQAAVILALTPPSGGNAKTFLEYEHAVRATEVQQELKKLEQGTGNPENDQAGLALIHAIAGQIRDSTVAVSRKVPEGSNLPFYDEHVPAAESTKIKEPVPETP